MLDAGAHEYVRLRTFRVCYVRRDVRTKIKRFCLVSSSMLFVWTELPLIQARDILRKILRLRFS